MQINQREQIVDLLSPNSIGCELGVFEGSFSEILANSNKFSKLYLVDLFDKTNIASSGDKSGNNVKIYLHTDAMLKVVKDKFASNENVEIYTADSVIFLNSMPDNYFDFIYIDTVHDYNHTKLELEASYRVIKSGGFICGHDYHEIEYPKLVLAVNEFCDKYKLSFNLTNEDRLESFIIQVYK